MPGTDDVDTTVSDWYAYDPYEGSSARPKLRPLLGYTTRRPSDFVEQLREPVTQTEVRSIVGQEIRDIFKAGKGVTFTTDSWGQITVTSDHDREHVEMSLRDLYNLIGALTTTLASMMSQLEEANEKIKDLHAVVFDDDE